MKWPASECGSAFTKPQGAFTVPWYLALTPMWSSACRISQGALGAWSLAFGLLHWLLRHHARWNWQSAC
eukprot:5361762-Lingulodinium_polyedra.AAC.1